MVFVAWFFALVVQTVVAYLVIKYGVLAALKQFANETGNTVAVNDKY